MSNLSDLMPAGASGKTIEATATATIASKAPVILNSAGTVTEVGETTDSAGTPVAYSSSGVTWNQAVFDSSNNKVVVSYNIGGTGATAVVATISGSGITYGTPVTISGAGNSYGSITYDSNTNRVVIAYRDYSNSDYGTAVVGAVSGTSISFGTPVVFESASTPYIGTTFDTNNNAVVISYVDGGNSDYGTAVVGTVTGGGTNSISFGTPVVFNSGATDWTAATFDTSNNRVVIAYMDDGNSDYGTAILGSVSGSVITFGGSEIVFAAHQTSHIAITYDTTLQKVVIVYNETWPDGLGTAIVGTVTGSYTMTFGTAVVFEPSGNDSFYMTATFDSNANKVVIAYQDVANSSHGTAIVGTVSGTTISFDTAVVFEAATTNYIGCAYDSNADKVAIVYSDNGNSDYGTGVVFSVGGTNLTATNFVGIADAGIATSATGTVVVQGGTVADANTTLPEVISFGSEAVYESATTTYQDATFDSNSNKVVIAYTDNGNSNYGTAIVGTVSGTSISYGTPVVFDSGGTAYMATTFDSNENKVVIAWQNSSSEGEAVVGTVSGTSISFGTPVVFETPGGTNYISATFDSSNNRVVIAFQDYGNSQYGTAIVGTVSGTAISFGTAVVFEAAATLHISTTFDSDANKVVISYQDEGNSQYGTGIVGTVSGTAISFGTAVVYAAAATEATGCAFDSNSNKVVIAYRDSPNSDRGTAIVGTVSGTSISYGTEVVFNSHGYTNYSSVTFDSNANKVVIAYQGGASPSGSASVGTVSGTAISFVTAVVFNSAHAPYTTSTFDSNSNKTVIAFQDDGNSSYGTGIVGTLGNDFTIGSNYYVQPDGTLATSAGTPSVKAGLATSTTQLLLNGDS